MRERRNRSARYRILLVEDWLLAGVSHLDDSVSTEQRQNHRNLLEAVTPTANLGLPGTSHTDDDTKQCPDALLLFPSDRLLSSRKHDLRGRLGALCPWQRVKLVQR